MFFLLLRKLIINYDSKKLLAITYSLFLSLYYSSTGELTLYDLVTHNSAHYELQVTHKLFGLCTLNTASSYYSLPRFPASPNYHGSSSSNDCSAMSISASPISVTVNSTPLGSRRESLLEKNEVLSRSESEEPGKTNVLLEVEDEESEWDDGDEQSEQDVGEQGNDMFVACAWNGTTYLIDWSAAAEEMMSRAGEDAGGAIREETGMEVGSVGGSDEEWEDVEGEFVMEQKPEKEEGGNEKNEKQKRRFHVVKFTFEERVCAFAAGKKFSFESDKDRLACIRSKTWFSFSFTVANII